MWLSKIPRRVIKRGLPRKAVCHLGAMKGIKTQGNKMIIRRMFLALLMACFCRMTSALAFDATEATLRAVQAYNRGDYQLAFRLLKQESDAGVSDAQVNLGYMYTRGQGTAVNRDEALRLYGLSANHGNGEGWNALGYRAMVAKPMDVEHAVEYFCRAVALGNPRAMNNLAFVVAGDTSFGADRFSEAQSLWTQAAESGDAGAMFRLATVLMNNNVSAAMTWLRRSRRSGASGQRSRSFSDQRGYNGALPRPVKILKARWKESLRKMLPPGRANVCAALVS